MSTVSTWLAGRMLDHFFRNTATAPSAQLFLRLYISDPTMQDTGTEVQGGGYVPQQISFTAPTVVDGNIEIANTAEIRFPVATADWGNISHFTIHTAATGGNMLAFAAVDIPKLIETGDEAKALPEHVKIRIVGNTPVASGTLA